MTKKTLIIFLIHFQVSKWDNKYAKNSQSGPSGDLQANQTFLLLILSLSLSLKVPLHIDKHAFCSCHLPSFQITFLMFISSLLLTQQQQQQQPLSLLLLFPIHISESYSYPFYTYLPRQVGRSSPTHEQQHLDISFLILCSCLLLIPKASSMFQPLLPRYISISLLRIGTHHAIMHDHLVRQQVYVRCTSQVVNTTYLFLQF